MINSTISLEELSMMGEKIYAEELKKTLENDHPGEFAVIDVEQKKYQIDADRLMAIKKAKKEFGDKLFYIIQIGSAQNSNKNFSAKKYAWDF